LPLYRIYINKKQNPLL